MIDLDRTRDSMLADIAASPEVLKTALSDPADEAFRRGAESRLVLTGPTRDAILPTLKRALATRFPNMPPERFTRDLGLPLKRALGNAYKRGNRLDPEKSITVELVVTGLGAVVAITDSGEGFDFRETFGRFRRQEAYFTNRGGGFASFELSGSTVSFAEGGKTILLRFLANGEASTEDLAASSGFMTEALSHLSRFRHREQELESCVIEALPECRPGQPEYRYVLDTKPARLEGPLVLTGRVLTEREARVEYAAAKQLRKGAMKEGADLVVPKPRNVFKRHPRLVLYELDRGASLGSRASRASSVEGVRAQLPAMARGLRKLHASDLVVDVPGSEEPGTPGLRDSLRDQLASRPDASERLRGIFDALAPAEEAIRQLARPVPIHGSFGWDCVFGDRAPFSLCRLHAVRASHPGLDVGGLLADVPGAEDGLGNELLEEYLAGDAPPWLGDVPRFIAIARLEKLDRALRARAFDGPVNGENGASDDAVERELARIERDLRID